MLVPSCPLPFLPSNLPPRRFRVTFSDTHSAVTFCVRQHALTNAYAHTRTGRDYWFEGADGGKGVHVPPVMMGEKCTTVPLSEACKDATCFHRGKVKPCSSAESCTARDVTAGVNVIAGGAGSATCIVKCPQSNLMCQASTVVFISPSDCQDVQVTPAQTSPDLFPAPYNNLPTLMFPYPQKVYPSSVIICNHSGERYWYAWDDATEQAWQNGAGHTLVPPLQPGQKCQRVETGVSWHRGFIAPCPKSDKRCFRQSVRSVTAGVNVLHIPGGGQGTCIVHCDAAVDTCRTASVVVISPSQCERVKVTAG
eukprot:Tamp_11116.p1 GENE.Tamp_11116~~Tamp_11116.p1  ORF type:complete len:309 (+),score=29.16 Tamp_11116:747-1673(+)